MEKGPGVTTWLNTDKTLSQVFGSIGDKRQYHLPLHQNSQGALKDTHSSAPQ